MAAAASHPISLPRVFSLAFAAFRLRWAPMLAAAFLLGYLPAAAPVWLRAPADATTTIHVDVPPTPASRLTGDATAARRPGHLGPSEMFVDADPSVIWLPLQFLCGAALVGALASLTMSAAAPDPRPWRKAARDTAVNLLPLIAINVIPAAALAAGAFLVAPALVFLGALAAIVVGALVAIPVLVLLAALAVAGPAQIAERAGVTASLVRSFDLTRGHRIVMLGLFAVWLVAFIASELITTLIPAMLGSPRLASFVAQPAAGAVASLVFDVFIAAFYLELRRAKEGLAVGELEQVFA